MFSRFWQRTIFAVVVLSPLSMASATQNLLARLPYDVRDRSPAALIVQNGFVSTVLKKEEISEINTYDGNNRRFLQRVQLPGNVLSIYGHRVLVADQERLLQYDLTSSAVSRSTVLHKAPNGFTWDLSESASWLLAEAAGLGVLVDKRSGMQRTFKLPPCQATCAYKVIEAVGRAPFIYMSDKSTENGAVTTVVGARDRMINPVSGAVADITGEAVTIKDNLLFLNRLDNFGCDPSTTTVEAVDLNLFRAVFPDSWSRTWSPPEPITHTVQRPCDDGTSILEGVLWSEGAKFLLFSQGDTLPIYDVNLNEWRTLNAVTIPILLMQDKNNINFITKMPNYLRSRRTYYLATITLSLLSW
ncbi:hypothetical protein [Deinococcus multiflagellatus]|uniref:Uncharacterized protein n=1 Tax=Deinococcus multiflagellatus TaxID=1656887 RepID=A0ABW1ZKY5_9DEIO|nr:hypothetical protein [Deinococcus multiflagellatus]MBZ9713116.1 hypothetical protein [Deinococcus multiflagellatus]